MGCWAARRRAYTCSWSVEARISHSVCPCCRYRQPRRNCWATQTLGRTWTKLDTRTPKSLQYGVLRSAPSSLRAPFFLSQVVTSAKVTSSVLGSSNFTPHERGCSQHNCSKLPDTKLVLTLSSARLMSLMHRPALPRLGENTQHPAPQSWLLLQSWLMIAFHFGSSPPFRHAWLLHSD